MEMEGVSPDKSAVRRLGEPRASRKMHTRAVLGLGAPTRGHRDAAAGAWGAAASGNARWGGWMRGGVLVCCGGSELKVCLRALNQSLGGGLRGPEAAPGG